MNKTLSYTIILSIIHFQTHSSVYDLHFKEQYTHDLTSQEIDKIKQSISNIFNKIYIRSYKLNPTDKKKIYLHINRADYLTQFKLKENKVLNFSRKTITTSIVANKSDFYKFITKYADVLTDSTVDELKFSAIFYVLINWTKEMKEDKKVYESTNEDYLKILTLLCNELNVLTSKNNVDVEQRYIVFSEENTFGEYDDIDITRFISIINEIIIFFK